MEFRGNELFVDGEPRGCLIQDDEGRWSGSISVVCGSLSVACWLKPRRVWAGAAAAAVLLGGARVVAQDLEARRLAAEQGDANAQLVLGTVHADGRGVPQDYGEAARWYRLAADQGNASAQASLGVLYAEGRGVRRDYREAVRWYRLAAEQGDTLSQVSLGYLYASGLGVARDYDEAVHWLRLAAERGEARAQYNLGFLYERGRGVPQDYVVAHMWLNLGASRLSGESRELAIKARDRVASRMSRTDFSNAQRMAREWQPRDP